MIEVNYITINQVTFQMRSLLTLTIFYQVKKTNNLYFFISIQAKDL